MIVQASRDSYKSSWQILDTVIDPVVCFFVFSVLRLFGECRFSDSCLCQRVESMTVTSWLECVLLLWLYRCRNSSLTMHSLSKSYYWSAAGIDWWCVSWLFASISCRLSWISDWMGWLIPSWVHSCKRQFQVIYWSACASNTALFLN